MTTSRFLDMIFQDLFYWLHLATGFRYYASNTEIWLVCSKKLDLRKTGEHFSISKENIGLGGGGTY